MADEFALHAPELVVGIEDPFSEEVAKKIPEALPLWEVLEPGLQHVLHIVRIRRHHRSPRADTVDDDRAGSGAGEQLGVPVQETAAVLVKRDQAADERVCLRSWSCAGEAEAASELGEEKVEESEEGDELPEKR